MAPVIERGQGCRVVDVDGNHYVEYGMGLRSVILGHAYPAVVDAVRSQLAHGTNFVRPARLELTAAETFLAAVTSQDMVKFTKDGSSANTAALRLARAVTGRTTALVCADHPFYSYDDWAMSITPLDAGIPADTVRRTSTFRFNDRDSVVQAFDRHDGDVACVFLEPARDVEPEDGFLPWLREECDRRGALLVFDENVTGFRWHVGGAQAVYGVRPDLATWGKAMANGHGLAALSGRREIMDRGGLRHPHDRVFLLSTTNGAESLALAAMIATIDTIRREAVPESLLVRGARLRDGVRAAATRHGVGELFRVGGRECLLLYETRGPDGRHSAAFRTLFLQETIRRGLLAPSFVVSHAHAEGDIDETIAVVDEALAVYRRAVDEGVEHVLEGRPVSSVHRRRNAD
jgi:glutamate-1-semialdehyde 2,1-aminomutase